MRRIKWALVLLLLPMVAALARGFAYPAELKAQLLEAYRAQPPGYQPRTRHFCADGQPCYINRLIREHSPYLLQHAHNPVDWYPWGEEAFAKARRENKPIFLSIGYAACHWCHVMEEESFDDLGIAEILNASFVAIKVDRERRPDVDEFFASVVMNIQGQQGWPMSVFLTPEGKPFYGGGYYPRAAFRELLLQQQKDWKEKEPQLRQQAQQLMQELQPAGTSVKAKVALDDGLRQRALKQIYSIFDSYQGGFGEATKFPREPWLLLFLDASYGAAQNSDALTVLRTSLTHMALGGIYDQIGGGFHRYATDPYWTLPHFEKMLYNQALLVRLYLRADGLQPDLLYRRVAQQTLDFLLAEMQATNGGFYSALDADSEGEEGRYYLWQVEDFTKILGQEDSRFAAGIFDVDEYGEVGGANVLYLRQSPQDWAEEHKIPLDRFFQRLDRVRHKLKQARDKRVRPARDEKIIMGWNALTITALAEGARHLEQPRYLAAAVRAADFIWTSMQGKKGFWRIYFRGKAGGQAQLKDYAFYLQALITLYDIQQDDKWLQRAKKVLSIMQRDFADSQNGGFFQAAKNMDVPVLVRAKSAFDKTLPAGNAIAAQMLIRLARRTGDPAYEKKARAVLAAFAGDMREVPSAHAGLLIAAHELNNGEQPLPLYAARGHARIDAFIRRLAGNHYQLQIDLQLDEGWHINAHVPLEDYLIPTRIDMAGAARWKIEKVDYPPAQRVRLGFSEQPLALYQAQSRIKADLIKGATKINPVIQLHLQACNNSLCLPPETLKLYPRLSLTPVQSVLAE
ncbi:Uncharacterized protein YyaL [hydrothermal vent metagenome]|uniref:Uncharacterized protein YyaL n=1 Tax=hydrothermal vent metagenome TaxID=652676 RepID=A0A3B1BIU8_9ZZZZ